MNQKQSRLERPYWVVRRLAGQRRGKTVRKLGNMKWAREYAEKLIKYSPKRAVVIIYLQCPSMPLDARYYVKDEDGTVYESRARTYNKDPETHENVYAQKWLRVKELVNKFHYNKGD